jgi:hypothetical protein
MSRVRRLHLPQKVVLVIGLAAVLGVVGLYVATDGYRGTGGGWFGYAPATGVTDTYFSIKRPSAMRTFVLPTVLVAVWVLLSAWVLGRPKDPTADD